MSQRYDVVDADAHVLEPIDAWQTYIDPKFREKAPRMIYTDDGGEIFYFCDEFSLGSRHKTLGGCGSMGARDGEVSNDIKYVEGRKGGFDPHARIPDMDKEGVDAVFLYPTLGLFLDVITDPAQAAANCRAYNRWLAEYCSAYPERLFGAAALPMQSVQAAIDEMRHCAKEFGFKACFVRPNPYNGRPLHHKDFYPVWEQAQEMGMAIAIHGGGAQPNLGADRFPSKEGFAVEHCVVHTFEMMAAAASFIMCGICDRFPRLRVGFMEAGGGWMLGWLDRMDRHVDDKGMNDTGLTHRPSELFARQCFISFEPTEKSLKVTADAIGPTNILWASDYPHHDGFWGAAKMIKKMGLKPELEALIMAEGAKRFYGMQ